MRGGEWEVGEGRVGDWCARMGEWGVHWAGWEAAWGAGVGAEGRAATVGEAAEAGTEAGAT